MSDEISRDDAEAYDAYDALPEIKAMWLALGRHMANIVAGSPDFLSEPSDGVETMRWARQAEACFWRATGDCDAADVDELLDPPNSPSTGDQS